MALLLQMSSHITIAVSIPIWVCIRGKCQEFDPLKGDLRRAAEEVPGAPLIYQRITPAV